MPYPTWRQWFNSLPDIEKGNMDTTIIADAWSQDKYDEDLVWILSADTNTVLFASNASMNIKVLHSFKNFGGTLLKPQNDFACLIGNKTSESVLKIITDWVIVLCSIRSPTINNIVECKSANEIPKLQVPGDNSAITYLGCTTFLPAPWLTQLVMGVDSTEPFTLLIQLAVNGHLVNWRQQRQNPSLQGLKIFYSGHGESEMGKSVKWNTQLNWTIMNWTDFTASVIINPFCAK